MRPIKFRAWSYSLQKMVYVSIEAMDAGLYPLDSSWDECIRPFDSEDSDCELMQFTGLLDKNGKEIWEGDIVVKDKYIWFDDGKPNYRGTVEWIFSQWQVVAHCVNPQKAGISDGINEGLNDEGINEGKKSDWEVIGNIYSDPHLLEGKENA